MEVAPTQSVPDTHQRSLRLLTLSSALGLGFAWLIFPSKVIQLHPGNAGIAAEPAFFWICTASLGTGAAWVALCGAPRNWRLGALALELLHVCVFHAALSALGKTFPLAPMLGGVACAGLFSECFRRRQSAATPMSPLEVSADAAPVQFSAEKNNAESASGTGLLAPEELHFSSAGDIQASPTGIDFEEDRGSLVQITEITTRAEETDPAVAYGPQNRHVPPPVEEPVEPVREECSVVHCEVSNHATLVNALPPRDFAELINKVLGIFQSMVEARSGICDRLGSDGMRAFFRSGGDEQTHAENAVRCALAIRARLESISEQCELDSGHALDLRFGINSGSMLVAPFGPSSRSALSVAGEAAEWGVRLAGANLLYGSKILLGTRTSALASDCVETRPIDLLQRQLPPEPPEEVFELLALRGTLSIDALERLTRYREGVEHFRAREWRQAAAALRAAQPSGQNDDAIDLLLHRISEQEALADYVVDGH